MQKNNYLRTVLTMGFVAVGCGGATAGPTMGGAAGASGGAGNPDSGAAAAGDGRTDAPQNTLTVAPVCPLADDPSLHSRFTCGDCCAFRDLRLEENGNAYSCCYTLDPTDCGSGSEIGTACFPAPMVVTDGGTPDLPNGAVTLPPPNCSSNGTPIEPTSASVLATMLVGAWLRCSGDSNALPPPRVAGIAFSANGTWNMLELDAASQLVKRTGFDDEGTWELLYTGGSYQLNVKRAGGGTRFISPYFLDSPRKLRLQDNMAASADLVPFP